MVKKLNQGQKGFTLIELLIVMGILSILAVLIVPRFINFLDQAKVQAHNANVVMLEQAVELAYVAGDITATTTESGDIVDTLISKGYIKENPDCPVDTTQKYSAKVQLDANKILKITVTPAKE